jgi:hypothetical protein
MGPALLPNLPPQLVRADDVFLDVEQRQIVIQRLMQQEHELHQT